MVSQLLRCISQLFSKGNMHGKRQEVSPHTYKHMWCPCATRPEHSRLFSLHGHHISVVLPYLSFQVK